MSFRTRPVLDRKHRPRWQDELRTQQLTIVGFAVAIALALGIFGAAAWNGYWEAHFRPVASVAGTTFDRSDLSTRERILTAEAIAKATELQAQLTGGPRDQLVQQQIDSLNQGFSAVTTTAAESIVEGAVLGARAADFGVSVSDEAVDAGIAERVRLPERIRAKLVLIESLPEDAEPDAEATEEQIQAAMEAAQEAADRVTAGEDFGAVATDVSDDFSAQTGGELGWFQEGDAAYGDYFEALADAEEGDLVGPIEVDRGAAVLQLVTRREATTDGGLRDILRSQGIDDATYRAYVHDELMTDAYRAYFADEVVVTPAEQRRVAEIYIAPLSGTAVPQARARHVLVQPDLELEDQADATDEQWDAALDEAREVAADLREEGADWWAIAEEHSDDTGSGGRGGDLGWYDPANPEFVTAFSAELAELEIGDISDPVRTEFGYHVIQKTAERETPADQAAELAETLAEDPDSFAELARDVSEDYTTAEEDGELGWVAPYQLAQSLEVAVFALTDIGEISEPIETETGGFTIYRLLETSESREIEDDRLEEIRGSGFERWLAEEVRVPVPTWLDPQLSTTTAGI